MQTGLAGLQPLMGCRNRIGGMIAGVFFILVGVVAYLLLGGMLRDALASRSWPTTQGQVTASSVRQGTDSDGDPSYSADITYTYVVNGQTYTSTLITTADGSTSLRGTVQEKVSQYNQGSTVTVYYNPDDPSYALLEPGLRGGALFLTAFIVCPPIIGILAFFGSLLGLTRVR